MSDKAGKRFCVNCGKEVTVRVEREGLIHTNGLYGCPNAKDKVAE